MSTHAALGLSWLARLRANALAEGSLRESASHTATSSWAIDFEGARLSCREMVVAVEEASLRLAEMGLRRGEIVAVMAPPSLMGICLIHAFLDTGIVMLPLNARLSEEALVEALSSTRVRALFVEAETSENDAPEMRRNERNARIAEGARCGLFEYSPTLPGRHAEGVVGPSIRWVQDAPLGKGSHRGGEDADERRALLAQQGAALVLQTSGTTGHPKGAVLSLANLIASATASQALLETCGDDRWLLCMPIFHIGGLSILIRSVLDGSSVVVHRSFDVERVAETLSVKGVTCVSFVATMLHRLIEAQGASRAPSSLRLLLLGGGPATQALLARAEALGYPVAPTYGLTEAASQVATRPPGKSAPEADDLASGLESLPGIEIRIVEDGEAQAEGEGEIEVRGPNVMLGYLDAPDATSKVLRGGWLATGDFGRIDAEGRLRVLDRRSDLILSGGENIYPAEIESVLAERPEIEDAAVVGRLDEEFGARPVAYLVLRDGGSADEEALRRHCEARLARFKVPVEFHSLKVLPRTASGKLVRRALQEREGS